MWSVRLRVRCLFAGRGLLLWAGEALVGCAFCVSQGSVRVIMVDAGGQAEGSHKVG